MLINPINFFVMLFIGIILVFNVDPGYHRDMAISIMTLALIFTLTSILCDIKKL